MPPIVNQMQWETVAVPIVGGVELNTRDRLIDPGNLAVADNVFYSKSGGPEKRRGYTAYDLYDAFIDFEKNPPLHNLYGFGLIDVDGTLPKTARSIYPQAGTIKDVLTYENKEIAWDGWRFFEPVDPGNSGKCRVVDAIVPGYNSFQIANIVNRQNYACASQNNKTRVVGYIEYSAAGTASAHVKVYDVDSGTLKFTATLDEGSNTPKWIRTVSCGVYCHVLVSDTTDTVVYDYTIHEDGVEIYSTTNILDTSTSAGISVPFDVWKFDETKFLVAAPDGVNTVKLTWVNANGTINSASFSQNYAVTVSGTPCDVAVAVHPVNKQIAIIYNDANTSVQFRLFSESGAALTVSTILEAAINDNYHLAVSPSYINDYFHFFWDRDTTVKRVTRATYEGVTLISTKTRHNAFLASRAFRVGNLSFVWISGNTTVPAFASNYQLTRYLVGTDLLPVANTEYGTMCLHEDKSWLPSVDFTVSEDGVWNNLKFHGALIYNERIDTEVAGDGTTTSHKAIKFYYLNFVPDKLSYAQAGKALYIAGGQLWSYDGDVLREANFSAGPVAGIGVAGAAGNLNGPGYKYRVDLCYKNAHNEECRSISFLSPTVTPAPVNQQVTLTFTQPITGVTNGYYLIFRNETIGTNWYLISSRTSPVRYDETATSISFVDNIADADLLDNEQHPANASLYLQPIASSPCELVTFGQNRLWTAGGELLPGAIWPSRLFAPGQTPSFNWALEFQVDKTIEAVTALAFQSDYGIVFKENTTHLVTGNVSPNIYQNVAPNVQLALSDRGCINFKSVTRLNNSISFQSANGYKVVNAGGQVENIGFPVETADGTCIGSGTVKFDEHVRFYQSDNYTLVFDPQNGLWTTFSFNTKPSAAVVSNRTGMFVISRGSSLLYETDGWYKDGDFDYHYTIKTAPLAAKIGGFQRVRRVYCVGEKEGIPPPVTMRIYQDGHSWWTTQVVWDYSDDLAITTIGQGTIGSGFIGNPLVTEFKDDIWKYRYRLPSREQKCENIAIELTDKGRINENKWIPVAFAIEIGTKAGIDRLSKRTIDVE